MESVACKRANPPSDTAADGGLRAPGDASVDTGVNAAQTPLAPTPLPAASVAAMVNPDMLPAYEGATGSIEGTVTVTGEPARPTPGDFSRCPEAERQWGHAFREGIPSEKGGGRPLEGAIVVVTGYTGFYLRERRDAKEVRIERCGPTSNTVTLTFGQRLEVKNLTNDFWTPMLEPGSTLVLTIATPHGDPAKLYPKKPGHYMLVDRDRKYAITDVYAFLHPLHTVSAPTGYYRIDDVPIGKVRVSSKHPNIEATAEREITVSAGVVHQLDLSVDNVNSDAGVSASGGSAPGGKAASPGPTGRARAVKGSRSQPDQRP